MNVAGRWNYSYGISLTDLDLSKYGHDYDNDNDFNQSKPNLSLMEKLKAFSPFGMANKVTNVLDILAIL